MSHPLYGPQDLLLYNAAHRVLICRECQYAIQKSAVSGHLLRHKIYREERQTLLSHVAQLGLLDSDDVIPPPPGCPPVAGLSVTPGYCCTRDGCDNLCASIKRMKKHQSEAHKETDLANFNAYARQVRLQTFFRGTKLRYYQVGVGSEEDGAMVSSTEVRPFSSGYDHVQSSEDADVPVDYASSGMSDWAPSQRTTSAPGSPQSSEHVADLNLEAMTYFRHYLTVTSASLPAPYNEPQAWSTSIVDHALKHQWLMYGLLALAAYNHAVTCVNADNREAHTIYGTQCASEFSNGFSLELVRQQILDGTDMSAIGDRIHHVLTCASWAVPASIPEIDHPSGRYTSSGIKPLMETLSNLTRWSFLPRSEMPDQEAIYSRAKSILEFDDEDITNSDPAYMRLLHSLRILPTRLSSALGRPDRVQEVLATLAATSSLVVSCELSFESDSKEAAWRGLFGWLAMLPQHFQYMIVDDNPAALVLLVYWTALVSRAERAGFWFLNGLAERIIRDVDERLANGESGLRALVQEFVS